MSDNAPALPRIAIVGAGGIAKAHLAGWLAHEAEIVAIVDPNLDLAEELKNTKNLQSVELLADLDQLADRQVDIAVLCTPPYLHAPQTAQALDLGFHVVVEKPITPSLASLDELTAKSKTTGLLVMPTFQNRWGRGPAALATLQQAGLTGAFLDGRLDTSWRRRQDYFERGWRGQYASAIGGAWACLGIHALDTCLTLLPAIEHLQAFFHPGHPDIEVDQGGVAIARLQGGGVLHLGTSVAGHEQSTCGHFKFEHCEVRFGDTAYAWAKEDWLIRSDEPDRQAAIDSCLAALQVPQDPHGRIDELWWGHTSRALTAWRAGKPGGNGIASARPVTEALSAIYYSSHTGEAVDLPLPAGHPACQGYGPPA